MADAWYWLLGLVIPVVLVLGISTIILSRKAGRMTVARFVKVALVIALILPALVCIVGAVLVALNAPD